MSNLFCSSIGKKLVMSLSGLFLIVFLIVHLSANLGLLFGEEVYNAICHFMDTNPIILVMVPVLALGFFIHICMAFYLTLRNRSARPIKYAEQNLSKSSSWESRNMLVLGIIVLGGLADHMYFFWAKMQLEHFLGGTPEANPYRLVADTFTNPFIAILYLVWVWALYFHLRHGFWSAFQTVGLDNQIWIKRWKCTANIYALLIAIGFTIIPLYFLISPYICFGCC